jgi:hypothetical protein
MTTRLQKFIERGSNDEDPGRAAYVLDVVLYPGRLKAKNGRESIHSAPLKRC